MKNYILLLIMPLLIIGCNKENSKKVYKQFDSIDITEIKTTNDEVSAFEGGEGFEEIAEVYGWKTNNDVVSNGDPRSIKGDTITIVGGSVFPPTLRGFGKNSRSQLLALIENTTYEALLIFNPETRSKFPQLGSNSINLSCTILHLVNVTNIILESFLIIFFIFPLRWIPFLK